MPKANLNGIEIHYRETGDGFPVVFVHGYTGNSRNWALTVPALSENFRTISVDLRGHGLSAKPTSEDAYTFAAMADDVFALLDQLGVRECFLVGHSMGGKVAQQLVLTRPQMFRALVLVDTAAENTVFRTEELSRLTEFARKHGMEATFEETARTGALTSPALRDNPQFVAIWREQFLMTSLEAYVGCAKEAIHGKSYLPRLKEIRIPTLIICGEKDKPFLEPSRQMHAAIPGSELVIIPGAGHGPQMETPEEFNRVLAEFLAKVRQTIPA